MKKLLLFSLSLLLVSSCGPRKDKAVEREPLEQAYRKLDQGNVDVAIADLEELRKTDSRPEVLEALASGYALRAGLKVENYWGFLVGFRAPLLNVEKIENSGTMARWRRLWGQFDGHIEWPQPKGFAAWAEMLASAELWRERIESLPEITESGELDLLRALELLKDHPKPGARLYRALLALIVVKHRVVLGMTGWGLVEERVTQLAIEAKPAELSALVCGLNLPSFQAWARDLLLVFQGATEDLVVSFPSQEKDFKGAFEKSELLVKTLEAQSLPEVCP